ncbi:MAG: hypothetical protein HFACDABA_03212 [Anaerolineales bacterium]|nr:hypothetical protein [Anaerolineales bacterium]
MKKVVAEDTLAREYFKILDETFVRHHGIYLDKHTSLFETLETITAEAASRPVGGKCATLAAQVAHVTFYLEVLENYILDKRSGKVDWDEVWRTVHAVTPEEWTAIQDHLKQTHQRVLKSLHGLNWSKEHSIGGALAILVHSAYHLGEIRQALCTLR